MKVLTRAGVSTLLITTVVAFGSTSSRQASAQLPPTVWGKSVHKPGDNQYDNNGAQQLMRHMPNTTPVNPNLVITRPSGGGGGGGGGAPSGPAPWKPTPKPKSPDVSLQPIPADEPVAPPGFPPIPERLELPGVRKITAMSFSVRPSARKRRSGGGGGGGAPAPMPFQGKKQGYSHFAPGAFSAKKKGGGGGGGGGGESRRFEDDDPDYDSTPQSGMGGGANVREQQGYKSVAPGSFGVQSHGYYKCGEVAPPGRKMKGTNEDTFGSSEDGSKPPSYAGASMAALKALGKEPKLDDKKNLGGEAGAPDAPTPVQINQASTQDLSLPDDDFQYRRPGSKVGRYLNRQKKRYLQRGSQMINSMPVPIRMPRFNGN